MRMFTIAGCAALLSGCALFGGGPDALSALPTESAPSAESGARPVQAAFRPAYAAGRPTPLAPCRRGAVLNGECASGNPCHQLRAESDIPEEEPAFTGVNLAPAVPVSE